eukprot:137843_1
MAAHYLENISGHAYDGDNYFVAQSYPLPPPLTITAPPIHMDKVTAARIRARQGPNTNNSADVGFFGEQTGCVTVNSLISSTKMDPFLKRRVMFRSNIISRTTSRS